MICILSKHRYVIQFKFAPDATACRIRSSLTVCCAVQMLSNGVRICVHISHNEHRYMSLSVYRDELAPDDVRIGFYDSKNHRWATLKPIKDDRNNLGTETLAMLPDIRTCPSRASECKYLCENRLHDSRSIFISHSLQGPRYGFLEGAELFDGNFYPLPIMTSTINNNRFFPHTCEGYSRYALSMLFCLDTNLIEVCSNVS